MSGGFAFHCRSVNMTMPLVLYCGVYCESAYGHLFFCYSCDVVASRLVVRFLLYICVFLSRWVVAWVRLFAARFLSPLGLVRVSG